MFSKEIEAKLKEKLNPTNIKQRSQAGQKLDYLEGWYVQGLLNEIFGHGGWSQEVKSITQVAQYEVKKADKTNNVIVIQAVVSLVIHKGNGLYITREDVGVGLGEGQNLSMIMEKAIKEAVTDGVKRAAKSLGDPFGLTLYDKDRAGVMTDAEAARAALVERAGEKLKEQEEELYNMLEEGVEVKDLKAWLSEKEAGLKAGKEKFPELSEIIDGMFNLANDYITISTPSKG